MTTMIEQFEALTANNVEGSLSDQAKAAYLQAFLTTEATAKDQGWEEGDAKYSAAFMEEYNAIMNGDEPIQTEGAKRAEALIDAMAEGLKEELAKVEAKEEAPKKDEKPKICVEEGCDSDKIYSRGLCRKHYEIHRITDADRPDCTAEGCDQKVYTKGLCRKHYVAQRSAAAHAGLSTADRDVLVEVVEALAKMRKGGGPLVAQAREILGMAPATAAIPVITPADKK